MSANIGIIDVAKTMRLEDYLSQPRVSQASAAKVAYVCAPIRSQHLGQRGINIARARRTMLELIKMGYAVICVHTMCDGMAQDFEETDLMELDLALIARCDVLVRSGHWELSQGCCAEIDLAVELGIPVIDADDHKVLAALLGHVH